MTLANGSRAAYLPTADAYGKGIYQETIAVLAAGSRAQEEGGDSNSSESRPGAISVRVSGSSQRDRLELGIPASRSARRMISSSARSVRRRGVTGHRPWARSRLAEQHC